MRVSHTRNRKISYFIGQKTRKCNKGVPNADEWVTNPIITGLFGLNLNNLFDGGQESTQV